MDYERLAADYAAHRTVQPAVLRALLEHGEITEQTRLLEIGCGTGNYLRAIRAHVGCDCTGVDPAGAMLATARERDPSINWLSGRGESLPLADHAIDLAYSVDVIHHVTDRPAHFAETRRVLVPGGRFVTITDSEEDIARRRPLSSHFPESVDVELRRYPPVSALHAELAAAGFDHLHVEHVEHRYPLSDISGYRARAYSSLHLIDGDAFARGIQRLEAELAHGPIAALSLYTLIWATVPAAE